MANPGLRFFILLCADLGLRHTTALSITPRHYNPIDKTIFFTTKNGFQQQLPVTPEIAHTMQFLPPNANPDNPVYATLNGYQTERGKRSRAMHAAFRKLKLDTGVRLELRIHDLRRSAAETAWAATKDLRAVQAILGHTNIATTNRYLHNRTNPDELRHTIEAMSRIREQHARQATADDPTKKERTQ